ncbi:hypothetical protein MVEN_01597800 [Mycena venus]|uniref:Uncharacterized protein n=1 Tax=Mycena venus TaxID=2733690 RepID=A0A8H6XSR9_9AGAR|nr:hypothetical protein MVEN_01597800 [Mycena venus]
MPTQRAVASLFGLTLALMHVSAQTVTLYAVSQDIANESQVNQFSIMASDSISVAGTNSHGRTRPSPSSAPLPPPPVRYRIDIDGIFYSRSANGITPETVVETCGFGTNGRGTCVETLVLPQTTETVTYSGNIVPDFTLVAATPSSKQNAAPRTAYTGWNVLPAAVVMALFHVA